MIVRQMIKYVLSILAMVVLGIVVGAVGTGG